MKGKKFSPRKVVGMGETILDIIFRDGRVVNAVAGGSTFNSMISLGRCGVDASLVSETGADGPGDYIRDFMEKNGVDSSRMLRLAGMQTPVSLAFLDENGDASYTFYKSPAVSLPGIEFPEVGPGDVVLFGSYYAVEERCRGRVGKFLDYARERGALIYYDVNFRPDHAEELDKLMPAIIRNMASADIVRGSADDFGVIYKTADAERIYSSEIAPRTPNFICTGGAGPVKVFGKNFRKDYPVEKTGAVVSTIGAGDNFNAGMVYGLLSSGTGRGELEKGLPEAAWDALVSFAGRFAADACGRMYNYVSADFAEKL